MNTKQFMQKGRDDNLGIEEYYELLQLGLMLLGIVTVVLAFLYIGYEKSEEK
jgi:hypothetical protein